MIDTDIFSPRYTGLGYDKRVLEGRGSWMTLGRPDDYHIGSIYEVSLELVERLVG